MDERFEELKSVLLAWGKDCIEDFLGYMLPEDEENEAIMSRLDEAFQRTPSDILERFYTKYDIF